MNNMLASNHSLGAEAVLWKHWRLAVAKSSISLAIQSLYQDLDNAVQAYNPTCWASGRCCKFDTFEGGHLLYVTGLEIAWVLSQPQVKQSGLDPTKVGLEGACAFQRSGLCAIHTVRPMGCRIFFCQKGTQDWQQLLYESFLGRLRQLHEQEALEYRYMEWRNGLKQAVTCGLGTT